MHQYNHGKIYVSSLRGGIIEDFGTGARLRLFSILKTTHMRNLKEMDLEM